MMQIWLQAPRKTYLYFYAWRLIWQPFTAISRDLFLAGPNLPVPVFRSALYCTRYEANKLALFRSRGVKHHA